MKTTIGLILLFTIIILGHIVKDNTIELKVISPLADTVYVSLEEPSDTLTIENVHAYIKYVGIRFDSIVISQVMLETGNLSCTNCSLDSNNLFGFRHGGKYIKFDHWKHSVRYYANWQYRKYKKGDYYQFLINVGYATDSNYIYKLKNLQKTNSYGN